MRPYLFILLLTSACLSAFPFTPRHWYFATPGTPLNLTGIATSDEVALTWVDNASNEVNYTVERSSDGVSFSLLTTLAANSTTYTDDGLTAYTGYYYRVRALGSPSDGNSAYSAILYVTSSGTQPLVDLTGNNGLVTASSSSGGSTQNFFDDNVSVKSGWTTTTGWIQYQSTFPAVLKNYTITSANNDNMRDPKSWNLLASNDGSNWTTLDTRTNETFPDRLFTKGYTLSNSTAYSFYRLDITANNGHGSALQLAEIEFNAIKGPLNFVGDFEIPDKDVWRDGGSCTSCAYALQIWQDTVRNGQYAGRFELRKSDPESNVGSWRSELTLNTEKTLKVERWYGFSNFLPLDYGLDPTPEILAQWHSSPDYDLGELGGQSPSLALRTQNGEWVVTWRLDKDLIMSNPLVPDSAKERHLGSYQRGAWTDWVFHVKWDYSSTDGLFEVWKNGEKVMEQRGGNAYNDVMGVYFKIGIYKAIWDPSTSSQSTVNKRVVYVDDVRVGNETATYADVAPRRTGGYTYPVDPFTTGNLVVARVGDDNSTRTLGANANPVFLDEYTTSGQWIKTTMLPITTDTANKKLTLTNSANEGLLTLSPDSTLLAIAGYNAEIETSTPNSTSGSVIDRTIGIINHDSKVNTTQSINDYNSSPRSVITNGSGIWLYGGGGGMRYIPLDATLATTLQSPVASTQVMQSPDGKGINIADNQLYFSQSSANRSRVMKVGTGLPTTGLQSSVSLTGVPITGGTVTKFFLVHLGPTGTTSDVLYYMNDGDTLNGISKYSLVSGTWTFNGNIRIPDGGVGLTGRKQGNGVVLYATSSSKIYKYNDTSGYNTTVSGDTLNTLFAITSTSRMKFRGIAFAPKSAAGLRMATAPVSKEVPAITTALPVQALMLYPNPGKSGIILRHPAATAQAKIDIFDVNGRLLHSSRPIAGQMQSVLNIDKLAKGLYMLVWYNGAERSVERFIKE